MGTLSKLAPVSSRLLFCPQLLHAARLAVLQARCSSERVFVRRPSTLYYNRFKDIAHFYVVGLGILPAMIAGFLVHVFCGPCELHDLPEKGPPPRHWQFERTLPKQIASRFLCVSDVEGYERNLAYFEKANILSRWRKIEQRVRHLEGERWDYKAWFYEPVSAAWTDYGKYSADRVMKQTQIAGFTGE